MREDGEPTISIREAAKWLARMAAKDGVVSPNERKLLKEFAENTISSQSLFTGWLTQRQTMWKYRKSNSFPHQNGKNENLRNL